MSHAPDQVEKEWFSEIQAKFTELDLKHAHRKRSPLIFIEAFEEFDKSFKAFEPWVWKAVERKHANMNWHLSKWRKSYEEFRLPAEEQRKRNEVWERMYQPGSGFLEGGRADGNG